jgi:membrane-associated protein
MEFLKDLLDIVRNLEQHLDQLVADYGTWVYALMFLVIFCETGLVVTPILPGDSLLFALGALCSRSEGLHLGLLMALLTIAAILGDSANYWLGSLLGPRIFRGENVRFLNRKHLDRTHEFFERYGGKTIIIARFVPIVRTFAPFVAGMGRMTYRKFMAYNVVGGIAWIVIFLLAGYWFGSRPFVKRNFELVILGIIFVSILPGVFEFFRERKRLRELEETLPP